MPAADLLVEVGTEELPPKSLARLGTAFASGVAAGLADAGIEAGAARALFSPRRLAVIVDSVPGRQPERRERRAGPAIKAAYDATGAPTKAAIGFATACGVDVGVLERDGDRVACTVTHPGRATAELLGAIVDRALAGLPIERRMRWGDGEASFVRPVHWLVMLHGTGVVDAEVFGHRAGDTSRGHRFHAPGPVRVPSPGAYVDTLAERRVRLDDATGSLGESIRAAAREAAAAVGGVALGLDGELADEVAALNEWPIPLVGGFDRRYLELPPEVLVTTLEHHQRYFPIAEKSRQSQIGSHGDAPKLLPYFVAFTNIESRDPDVIRSGNERVVVPRLEDAMFFWRQDRSATLGSRREALSRVTWQNKLGNLADKSARVAALATRLAPAVGADEAVVRRAAELSKCDLLTAMVGEFPELQGTMGKHYARNDDEPEAVAVAIEEHYLPRGAGDRLPESPAGRALALADRIDTLVGVFAAGMRPSSDKDPFALRRAAAGVVRILVEGGIDVDLVVAIEAATAGLPDPLQDAAPGEEVFEFVVERLRAIQIEAGVRADVFDSVAAVRPPRPADFVARLRAVERFIALPEAAALAAANKRITNILRQAEGAHRALEPGRFVEAAERELWHALERTLGACGPLLEARRYADALAELAALRGPVDAFFDGVMVMTDDPVLRNNRIALLAAVAEPFSRVADIGRLQL